MWRCEDVKMWWRCEDVRMRRCEDEKMWRWDRSHFGSRAWLLITWLWTPLMMCSILHSNKNRHMATPEYEMLYIKFLQPWQTHEYQQHLISRDHTLGAKEPHHEGRPMPPPRRHHGGTSTARPTQTLRRQVYHQVRRASRQSGGHWDVTTWKTTSIIIPIFYELRFFRGVNRSTTKQFFCTMALPLWKNSPTFCPLLSTKFWNFWQGHQVGEHHVGAGA